MRARASRAVALTDVPGATLLGYGADEAGNRLKLGLGRQIEVGAKLRVYSRCGETTEEAVFACVGVEVLGDQGDVPTFWDSAGTEVAELRYDKGSE